MHLNDAQVLIPTSITDESVDVQGINRRIGFLDITDVVVPTEYGLGLIDRGEGVVTPST